jgi:hypothetical protein
VAPLGALVEDPVDVPVRVPVDVLVAEPVEVLVDALLEELDKAVACSEPAGAARSTITCPLAKETGPVPAAQVMELLLMTRGPQHHSVP